MFRYSPVRLMGEFYPRHESEVEYLKVRFFLNIDLALIKPLNGLENRTSSIFRFLNLDSLDTSRENTGRSALDRMRLFGGRVGVKYWLFVTTIGLLYLFRYIET